MSPGARFPPRTLRTRNPFRSRGRQQIVVDHDLGPRREKCVQQRYRTEIPNVGRDRSRGIARVGPPDLAISSYGYCEDDPEFDERADLVTRDNP